MSGSPRRRLLILWYSATGASRSLAQAAHDGALASGDCDVLSLEASAASSADLLAADAYLFVAPEMLGSLAGPMKDLFDRCYYDLLGKVEARAYALMVSAGSDGSGAVRQHERIVTGWRLRKVADACIVCTRAQTPEAIRAPKRLAAQDLERAAELGLTLASGLALGLW